MAKNNVPQGSGRMPDGQTSRGYPSQISVNPKDNSTTARRPEIMGHVAGEGGAELLPDSDFDRLSDEFPGAVSTNPLSNRGNPGSEPDPAVINRGYSAINDNTVPAVRTVTSAKRSFSIADPGDGPQPDGDTRDTPTVPKFGTGTNGE